MSFNFLIEPKLHFTPKIIIHNVSEENIERIGESSFKNLVFNVGLAEIPSYWKATCSPEIIIETGFLDKNQITWWRDLFIKGMGQFFYENKIDWRKATFLRIKTSRDFAPESLYSSDPTKIKLKDRYLVPLAGGRDSIVTTELLKKRGDKFVAFCVNPSKETKAVLKVAGVKNPIIVERHIDPNLLKLNKKGYLNGHTPFTSVLSFLSVLCAAIFDYKNIAFSNEKSANEGNLKYLGTMINHQYSKSAEFEKKFKDYAKKYLAKNLHYFSLLRKYSDLKISRMFTKHPQYFPVFSSCNRGRKLNKKWCRNCPKCLFVYMTLYPFLEKRDMAKIFGEDLFNKKELLPVMQSLIDLKQLKPFECVGTKRESKMALGLSLDKAKKMGMVPFLLQKG